MVKLRRMNLQLSFLLTFFPFSSGSIPFRKITSKSPFLSERKDLRAGATFRNNKNNTHVAKAERTLLEEADIDEVIDSPLLKNIDMLSNMLADVIKAENSRVYELYTLMRKEGMERAADPENQVAFKKLKKFAFEISPQDTLIILRTFSVALNLVNSAEVAHRLRTLKLHYDESDFTRPLPFLEDSVSGTIEKILHGDLGSKEEIWQRLVNQKVEIVLTAHPTEVNRKTLLNKYHTITRLLGELDRSDLLGHERKQLLMTIQQTISAIWGTDEIRRKKPTPQEEAAGGNLIIESVLWDAVPSYLRKLNEECKLRLGKGLPLDAVPIKFASWMGGDRDGNPNVTPQITIEVVNQQRLRAANLFIRDMNTLYNDLAISSRFSEDLVTLAKSIPERGNKNELYRRIILDLKSRLIKTVKMCNIQADSGTGDSSTSTLTNPNFVAAESPIISSEDLLKPLLTIHSSLLSTGFGGVASGALSDTIRRLYAFGTTLVPLDIREESTKHTNALDTITRYLGLGSYKAWDEDARINFLRSELANKRPLFQIEDLEHFGWDEEVVKTLKTYQAASSLGVEALGAYVISQCKEASDILAVLLLQKQFGMTKDKGNVMRVVPLFETLRDLEHSAEVLDTLFSVSTYVGAIGGQQEVMVGYSDSAKDAGRLAACWAQYTSQESMVAVAKKHNVQLTFFHGKGGTVGRGGNPALYRAIQSHPPGTINGRFRVTEQGEMITQNFGSLGIAEHTLDIYTSGVLSETFTAKTHPSDSWRKQMDRVSETSCHGYRELVRETPNFVPYFRQATPELELGTLNIGSRPAKRNPKGGIESLRAIPWTFAWTQTRMNLSAWLGVNEGLTAEDPSDRQEMKDMYTKWPWFRENIDLIAMILSKTDFSITENYDKVLVDPALQSLGDKIRQNLVGTRKAILEVSGSTDFAGPHVQLLRASTKIRTPYVDSINFIQAELLRELRAMPVGDDVSEEIKNIRSVRRDALIVSINGIAQGMKNSG